MRFASRFAKYRHGIRSGRFMVLADGQQQELRRELIAVFKPADQILTEAETQFVMKNMVHKGLPIDRDTEEHLSPRSRISGFDTVLAQNEFDWTDEEREIVEQKLLTSEHLGSDHIELKPEPAALPWPTYNTDDAETIAIIAKTIGLVDQALRYERENANRPEVIEALENEPVTEQAVVVDAS